MNRVVAVVAGSYETVSEDFATANEAILAYVQVQSDPWFVAAQLILGDACVVAEWTQD